MLNLSVRNTRKLIRKESGEKGIRIGNRFTKKESAFLLASMLCRQKADVFRFLDPGAGTGILTAALTEELCRRGVKEIYAVAYETEPAYWEMLELNLRKIRRKCHHDYGVKFRFEIRHRDFLSDYGGDNPGRAAEFHCAIMNPPDDLCEREEASFLRESRYFSVPVSRSYLFLAAAMRAVLPDGEILTFLPTAFATVPSVERLRIALLQQFALRRIHLFSVQEKKKETTGERNDVLRKHMLLSCVRCAPEEAFTVSDSYDEGATVRILPPLRLSEVLRGEEKRMILLQSESELVLLRMIESLPESLHSLGLQMRTGLVLPSRYPELLSDTESAGMIPLLSPKGIENGHIRFPLSEKNQYILPRIPSLSQANKNMLLIKRVPAKADKRHLYCGVYLASQFPHATRISTQNKLMYLDYADGREMDAPFVYGLYTLFNSTLYERYFSIVSKSSQVNAGDYKDLPLPTEEAIRSLGRKVMTTRQYSAKVCDILVKNSLSSAAGA